MPQETRPFCICRDPVSGARLIVGHTKAFSLIKQEEKRIEYARDLESRGEHLVICHASGFANIDCRCGYDMPNKALVTIRLVDLRGS